MDIDEFKRAIEACWESITIDQIRDRIREMPERCRQVIRKDGSRVRALVGRR